MGSALGGWLEGPQLPKDTPPGVRLGLPENGPGSVVGFGYRLAAFGIDAIIANLLVGVGVWFGVRYSVNGRGLAILIMFLLQELVLVSVSGQTIGMRFVGIRLINAGNHGRQSWPWILVRTLLLALLVPVFIWDRDLRGSHDRAAGTVMVRDPARAPAAPGN